jgi:hypothetical protein
LAHNIIGKSDQPVVYASRLFNNAKQNYSTTKRKNLTMVFALHKFKHYLLRNKFVYYVYHMAIIYLVNKPHASRKITRWLLFMEYDFTLLYKPSKTHIVAYALSSLLDVTKLLGV